MEDTNFDALIFYDVLSITFADDVVGENNSGTTILLMHDAMGNRQQLVYTAEFLSDHGYRVVSFDFPGLGSKPNERLTMDTACDATMEMIRRHCNGGIAVLVGFGMGGYVAMVFASRHPEMVRALVLCNTSMDLSGISGSIVSNMMGAMYKITPRKSLWSLVVQQHPTANKEKLTRCYLKNVVDYDRWSACSALLSEPHQGFFRESLRSYKGKVIMIVGDEDCKYAEDKFSAALYDGRLSVIKGGHDLMAIDDVTANEFHQVIDGFLETLNINSSQISSQKISSPSSGSSLLPSTSNATASSSSTQASSSSSSSSNPMSSSTAKGAPTNSNQNLNQNPPMPSTSNAHNSVAKTSQAKPSQAKRPQSQANSNANVVQAKISQSAKQSNAKSSASTSPPSAPLPKTPVQ